MIITLAHTLRPLFFSLFCWVQQKHSPDSSWLSILDIKTQASEHRYRKTLYLFSSYHCEPQVPTYTLSVFQPIHLPLQGLTLLSISLRTLKQCDTNHIYPYLHTSTVSTLLLITQLDFHGPGFSWGEMTHISTHSKREPRNGQSNYCTQSNMVNRWICIGY